MNSAAKNVADKARNARRRRYEIWVAALCALALGCAGALIAQGLGAALGALLGATIGACVARAQTSRSQLDSIADVLAPDDDGA